jgi:hypothetical protein
MQASNWLKGIEISITVRSRSHEAKEISKAFFCITKEMVCSEKISFIVVHGPPG